MPRSLRESPTAPHVLACELETPELESVGTANNTFATLERPAGSENVSDVPDDLAGLSEALARSPHQKPQPASLDSVPTAEVVAIPFATPLSRQTEETAEALVVDEPIHTGSPFATHLDADDRHLARGAAIASLAIGLWGMATFWVSYAAIVNGLLGIFLGAWGTRSNHRRQATLGLLTSVATLIVTMAWWTYQQSGR